MDSRIGRVVGPLVALAGLALLLFGFQGRETTVEAGPPQAVTEDPQVAINVNTSPIVAVHPERPEVLVAAGRVDAPG